MNSIAVTLTSYNMGDVTEADYDAWVAFVSARIHVRPDLNITVEASPFGRGKSEDYISGYSYYCKRKHLASWAPWSSNPFVWRIEFVVK